jgi:galactokinase
LADRSQEIAEKMLGNQIPQTSFLQRSARELGAVAASGFGAGFGGSVWALVRADQARDFAERWAKVYQKQYPVEAGRSRFVITKAAGAAFELPFL